ncbi:HvfC/BufC N-terminal domain-containing protein [Hyalangium versicolor]|uniref:HvfC/BufC N-terminal domain-containing protein n=1 Tax=Hyalangium versicolor TaxID=2861190 RepID=UPI001CCAAE6E|nr:putative DNA-binding domain-containing protein [Hyalangium versicolor]
MKPGLRHFFDSMADYFGGSSGVDQLRAAHPGWDAPVARVAVYGRFVRGHVRSTLEKLFPLTRNSVGAERWTQLVEGYTATRPGRHFEMNRMGEGFPTFVADVAQAQGLPAFAPALARFEWADWAVYASEERVPEQVEQLTVNPTLTVLQHPFQLCAYVRTQGSAQAPADGEEMALLWRHPRQLNTWFVAAQERTLLVLKMAVEGLSPGAVAAATGVAEAEVRNAVEECSRQGIVLTP